MGCSGGKKIKDLGSHMEGFDSILGRYLGLKKECAYYVIDGSDDAFGFIILLFCVRLREA